MSKKGIVLCPIPNISNDRADKWVEAIEKYEDGMYSELTELIDYLKAIDCGVSDFFLGYLDQLYLAMKREKDGR